MHLTDGFLLDAQWHHWISPSAVWLRCARTLVSVCRPEHKVSRDTCRRQNGECILTRLHWHYCRFFFVVHFLSIMALVVYLISSAYNFIWILHPRNFNLEFNGTCKFDDKCRMNALRRLLHGCQRISSSEYSEYSQHSHTTTVRAAPSGDRPKIRLDLYFDKKSMDFGLLMDLLAEASGIVQSLRWSEMI